jgi:hypothetical protein
MRPHGIPGTAAAAGVVSESAVVRTAGSVCERGRTGRGDLSTGRWRERRGTLGGNQKVVDIGIQRTLDAIRDRRGDIISQATTATSPTA